MNITKLKPIGIDYSIQQLQTYLYEKLSDTWDLNESNSLFTGRCYNTETEDGYIPEIYIANNEYSELLLDDTKKAQMFFTVGETINHVKDDIYETDCSIIFMTNVGAIYSSGRCDEEIRKDVTLLTQKHRYGFYLNDIELGIENVFREYLGWRIKTGMRYKDMQPFHCFRFNFKLTYNINC